MNRTMNKLQKEDVDRKKILGKKLGNGCCCIYTLTCQRYDLVCWQHARACWWNFDLGWTWRHLQHFCPHYQCHHCSQQLTPTVSVKLRDTNRSWCLRATKGVPCTEGILISLLSECWQHHQYWICRRRYHKLLCVQHYHQFHWISQWLHLDNIDASPIPFVVCCRWWALDTWLQNWQVLSSNPRGRWFSKYIPAKAGQSSQWTCLPQAPTSPPMNN